MPYALITLLLFCSAISYGQNASFSSEPEQFLKDVEKQLGSIDRQKTKAFMLEFEPNWLTNFSSAYQSKVVTTCNLIMEKRLSLFPDVYGYLLSVHSFVKTNQPAESFQSWHKTIDALLNSKKSRKFRDFIEVCSGFFTDGTIYNHGNHLWKVRDGSYKFVFSKQKPIIDFQNVTLACFVVNHSAKKKEDPYLDSTVVRGTSGLLEPLAKKWTGRGGIVDWQKVGMDKKTNFAKITDYVISLKQTKIESDSATVYTDYYDEPLQGKFSDMAKKINREMDRVNPQFISFSRKVIRKNILPDVDYVGGFAIEGAYFHGVGYNDDPASLVFYQDDEPFIKASALRFKVNDKGVRADECRITLYLNETDTIFHPGLTIRYDLNSMEMVRDKQGLAQAPFKDSYHQLDMYVDKIIWHRDDPNLSLGWHFQAARKFATFESQNYFSERIYNKIQGMNRIHPLVGIYGYAYKYDLEVLPISKVSGAMGFTNEQAIPILIDLANQGFLNYNKSQKTITIQPKMKKYIDARGGRRDYDHILFKSNLLEIEKKPETTTDGLVDQSAIRYNIRADSLNKRKAAVENFGTLNLKSMDLKLNEVDPIEVSPAQNVVIFPDAGDLLIKKDLDFLFSGAVMAGKSEFYLNAASFDYKNFLIKLIECDAALLRVKPIFGGSNGLVPMYSHFERLKGKIEIDHPSNRSGKETKKFTNYPILTASRDSYIFYDHKSIYGGVYDSADFYFKVDPFVFDSLDNYNEFDVAFEGELRSAGIFPKFRETITIQEDYSFGFKTKAPEGGFNFYGENAKFDNEIKLSNEGLRGAGEINFVTSNSKSDNFIFFPDSTMGLAQYTNRPQTIDEGPSIPDVVCQAAMVTYVPKKKILKARAERAPLFFFDGECEMNGITYLTPEGMSGRGLMYFKEAELGSRNFHYSRWVIDADTSDFNLESKGVGAELNEDGEKNPLAFNTTNVQAHVDFESRKGEFKSNNGEEVVEFPKNQYICYMDMFTWYMDNDEMELSKRTIEIDTDLDLAGSNFYSVHPDQDSLSFAAPKAKFELSTHIIRCSKVEYIDVADARIYPPDQKVTIRKKAKMDPFEGAEILANNITKYHRIKDAHVEIFARKKYTASGNYSYIDSQGEEQIINFEKIELDTAFQTVAEGVIAQDANFHLSDKFDFYGSAELRASEQFLTFDGATRINHECNQFARNWLSFRTDIDPNNIQIPVSSNMKDLEGKGIAVGLVKRNSPDPDSLAVYPAFLSSLIGQNDDVLFTSYGVLNFNEVSQEFRIASKEKLINRADTGNYISLHIESCSMEGDGEIDLSMNLPGVELRAFGTVKFDAATKIASMSISGSMNFFYDKKGMKYMADGIIASEGLSGIDIGRTSLEQAIREESSKEDAENIKSDYALKGEINKLPKAMDDPIYFTNVRMVWSERAGGFISRPISGIVGIYGTPIMKDFNVRMLIEYREAGDRGMKLGYLVELPPIEEQPGDFYYYRFQRQKKKTELSVCSSNKELEDYLFAMKEDKKKEAKFEFDAIGAKRANVFLSEFRRWWDE
ncbi:hypothetical protein JYT74_01865 [Crocinitomix catalasitica]|nr:hypothetical protein [Crocinitomix catalasitica]